MPQGLTASYFRLQTLFDFNHRILVKVKQSALSTPENYGCQVPDITRLVTGSLAGQHESYLNIRGADDLFEDCRRRFASVFTDRAIVYRMNNGFDHFKVGLSVGVMKMVRSDRASSGVIFTLDTESGFRDLIFIVPTW